MTKPSPQKSDLKAIFEARFKDLVRYIEYRLPNKDDARDLAQEAFFRLLRRSRDVLIENPEAYLFRIAGNLAYEQRLRHPMEGLSDEELVDESAVVPESSVDHQQRLDRLVRVLSRLPPLPRAALILQRRDGMTYAEIGAELNTSTHMVKKYIAIALLHCREELGDFDDES